MLFFIKIIVFERQIPPKTAIFASFLEVSIRSLIHMTSHSCAFITDRTSPYYCKFANYQIVKLSIPHVPW